MVKYLLTFLLLFTSSFAQEVEEAVFIEQAVVQEDPLVEKIKSFLDESTYVNNKEFIQLIFDPKEAYYEKGRVDVVKVVQTLKENGLLKLFFKKPQTIKLNFKTSGSPLFFVKLMDDTLRNIGYYRYMTTASNLDASEFTWNISLTSEYATDPLILEKELRKSGCKIIDIERENAKEWTYVVDISLGFLNVPELENQFEVTLRRSMYAHWLNVSKIKTLTIKSSRRNSWYPYIAYYDASLHLLKVIRKDTINRKIRLSIPQNAKYIKISDLYTLKNVRDALTLLPYGEK
jgi:hypothetical protein